MDNSDEASTRIVEVAKILFLDKGYHKTEMKDIAKVANLSRSTLYRRFPTKESLAFPVSLKVLEELFPPSKGVKGGNGWERLHNLMHFYAERMVRSSNHVRYLAEFDFTFCGEEPELEAERNFMDKMHQSAVDGNPFYEYVRQGVEDGSILPDIDMKVTSLTIINALFAMGQRILVRQERIHKVHGYSSEMIYQTADILAKGLKNSNADSKK